MKILVVVAAVLIGLIAVVVLIGYMLPVGHRASRQAVYPLPPDSLYALLADVERYPAWRKGVKTVEVMNGGAQFREVGEHDAILYAVEEAVPGRRRVTRIADKSLPYGGAWTYELSPSGTGTTLRITENGEVYNPVFRFMSKFVMSQTATIDAFLSALGAKTGAEVHIRD